MPISTGWLAQISAKVRALFTWTAPAVVIIAEPPSVVVAPQIEVQLHQPQLPRMLAARIACQAKLNVPVGKKPRIAKITPAKSATRRPKKPTEVKSTVSARSVYLPAKHLAAKTRPKPRNNIIALPVTAKIAKPHAKAPAAKLLRIAA